MGDTRPEGPASGRRSGPAYMVLATLCFTLMLSAVKVVREDLSAVEVVMFRGLVSVPVAYLAVRLGRGGGLHIVNKPLLLLRVVLGFGAMTCFFTAAKGLSVADLTIVSRLQPIVIALVAPLLLGAAERASWRIWLMLVAGIVGCGVLLAPELAVGNVYGMWALGAVVTSSGAHLCLRRLGATDHSAAIVVWFQVAVTVLAVVLVPLTTGELWRIPGLDLWPWLAAVGLLASMGQLLMTRAYSLDRASVVSGAGNISPLWAVLADVLIFATLPGWSTLIGGGIVTLAALGLVFWRASPTPENP